MIQRCNIHQRDVLHAVVAAQAVDQSVGGIHGGDAGDAELHGLAAQANGIAFGVAALGAGGEDIDVYKRQSPPSSVLSTAVWPESSCVVTDHKGCARCGT